MKESFKQKMQENKPPLTLKNTKKNICLEKKQEFFLTRTPNIDSLFGWMGPDLIFST